MSVTQQIAANYIPFFRYKTVSTGAFGAGANSVTVADPSVAANSVISFHATASTGAFGSGSNSAVVADPSVASNSIVIVTATAQPSGLWFVTQTAGTGFTVTSSDPESSTSFNYIVL